MGLPFRLNPCILGRRCAREHSAGRSSHDAPVGKRRALVRDRARAIRRTTVAGEIMARITRRRLLKVSAFGAVAAQTGGLAAILATGRAPAFAQGTTVHWLRWADFVPASDVLLRGQITQECQKATGITLKVETINANDLQARITSAIQSGTGPDIIMAIGNWPQLYAESLADVSDVTEEIGGTQGGYYDAVKLVATVGNKWIGVPWTVGGGLIAYRKSWFEDVGYKTFPESWDALRDAGKKLKANGRPLGQTAWDDTSNNRAFLAGSISATNNGASIYIEAKRKPESYQTETGAPMWQDILHARIPRGPGGQFTLPIPFTDLVMGYSRNQKPAKDFLRWIHSKPVFAEWFSSQQGYSDG